MSSKLNVNYLGAATPGGDIKFTDPIGVATFTSLDFNVKSITVGTGATVYNPEDNVLALGTNDVERLRVSSSGRLLIGTDASRNTRVGGSAFSGLVQVESDSELGFTLSRFVNTSGPPRFVLQKARGTGDSPTIVQEDDNIGQFLISAWDGDTFTNAAKINVEVDGTPGDDDMPGRIVFQTTPDGSNVTEERLRITSDGQLELRKNQDGVTGRPSNRIVFKDLDSSVAAGQPIGEISWYSSDAGIAHTNSYIRGINEGTNGRGALTFGIKSSGSAEKEAMRIDSEGKIGIGTDDPENDVHIMDGSATMKMTSTASANSTRLILESETDSYGGVHFGDPSDEDVGRIRYYHGGSNPNTLWFSTVAQARVAINADGKLGIGTDGMGTDSLCSNGGVDICSRGGTGKPALVIGADNSHAQSQSRTNDQQKDTRIGMPHYSNSEECPCIVSAFASASDTSMRFGGGTSYLNGATELKFYTQETNTTLSDADIYRVAIHKKGLFELRTGDNSVTTRGWRMAIAEKVWDTDGADALFDLHMVGGFGSLQLTFELRDSSSASTGGAGVRIGTLWVTFRGSGNDITTVNCSQNNEQYISTGTLAQVTWSAAVQDTSTIRLTATPDADSSTLSVYLWGSSPHFATDSYGIEAL